MYVWLKPEEQVGVKRTSNWDALPRTDCCDSFVCFCAEICRETLSINHYHYQYQYTKQQTHSSNATLQHTYLFVYYSSLTKVLSDWFINLIDTTLIKRQQLDSCVEEECVERARTLHDQNMSWTRIRRDGSGPSATVAVWTLSYCGEYVCQYQIVNINININVNINNNTTGRLTINIRRILDC